MPDIAGQLIDADCGDRLDDCEALHGTADFPGVDIDGPPERGGVPIIRYTMVGMDAVTAARDTWEVIGLVDSSAAQYVGGLATPLRDVHILSVRVLCP